MPAPPAGPVYALGSPVAGDGARLGRLTAIHNLAAGRLRIGRLPDNDVVLDDPLVSRRHAELHRVGHTWHLIDLKSGNGTFVNGRRVTTAPITAHDVISVGFSLLQLDGDRLVECLDMAPEKQRHLPVAPRRDREQGLEEGGPQPGATGGCRLGYGYPVWSDLARRPRARDFWMLIRYRRGGRW